MFAWWIRLITRHSQVVLVLAVLFAGLGATWGFGVFGTLSGAGFDDPASESSQARERITRELGSQDVDVLVLYRSDTATVDEPEFRAPVTAALQRVRAHSDVAAVTSYFETEAPALVSGDRRATYAVVRMRAADLDTKRDEFAAIRPLFDAPGVHTDTGGFVAFQHQVSEQSSADILRAELFAMPLLAVLLVLIFGGLVAASTPLLVGGLAILGAFVAVRLLTLVTDVSVFAINVVTLVGLGMAIDYALFIVSRFREELAAGHDPVTAGQRTMATAGRTVLVSGLTIALAMASLLVFPQVFLRSMGLGGLAAVLVAMIAALTVLPALLVVLGHRIDALRVPLPWHRRRAAGAAPAGAGAAADKGGGWARIARSVMRRPGRYLIGVLAVLTVLAVPFLQVEFAAFDERVLPAGAEARVVEDTIRDEFPGGGTGAPIEILLSGVPAGQAEGFADRISALPDARSARVAVERGGSALIEVTYPGEPAGAAAQDLVRSIRDLAPPAGARMMVTGQPAVDLDMLDSLGARLPWMAAMMAAATLVLLFLAFGSVVLPVKAVLMNLVSLGASFGVVVWIFQDGHLAGLLGFTPTGTVDPSNPILMLAILFGLATDYEVFLLSRVREEWDRTGDNTASVAAGLQHTGRIITAAALLLVVVVAGFATGGITFIKMIGVGIIVAIVVDATLVRVLLVPATMRLLGRWNWWAPKPLAAFYRRFGIRESPGPVGRPAGETAPEGGVDADGSGGAGSGADRSETAGPVDAEASPARRDRQPLNASVAE